MNNISKYKRTRLYRYISENIPEGIVLFDNKITYVNPAFEKLCGLSEKELYKLEFQSIFSEKSLLNFSEELDKLKSGTVGKIESEFEILYKKTKKRDVFIKVKEIFFEEKKSFLAIITNISKQKNDLIKMGELAYLDTLTGIYNRRKFDDLLKNEIARVKRYKHSLGVLYFDIDHFKKVNDNYGHNEGDYVLRKTVQEIALHIRATDIFARVGGEEFVLLLPEVTADSLVEAAEHIRKIIQDCIYEKVNHITISIGATMYKPNERGSTLIKRSDRALYKAKNTGRNRVVFL